ncbi:MAG: prepilin-type N-terminal cleavage/methylation domain-containing protein [Armatimonadetes bacterium]|nr:prepilin-type N-terminal cleavage/methylation domain-containing protein [Armatimonadota bacterium]
MTWATGTSISSSSVSVGHGGAASSARICRRRGVTLIEMIVIVIIIAVVSSAAVPAYSRVVRRVAFRQAVTEVADLLAWSRHQAATQGIPVTVRMDAQRDELSTDAAAPPGDQDVPVEMADKSVDARPPSARRVSLPEDVRIAEVRRLTEATGAGDAATDADTLVTFEDDGSCGGAGIQIVSRHGYTADLEVAAATGRVFVSMDGAQPDAL